MRRDPLPEPGQLEDAKMEAVRIQQEEQRFARPVAGGERVIPVSEVEDRLMIEEQKNDAMLREDAI